MKAAVFAFTKKGANLAETLLHLLENEQYNVTIYTKKEYAISASNRIIHQNLKDITEQVFSECRLIIFVSALGIAVRAIAPFVKDKTKDPAVLCMDDGANFIISVLSGHIGGANQITNKLAKKLHATPVITTATDTSGIFSVDEWAVNHSMVISNITMAKKVSKYLLDEKEVGLSTDFRIKGTLPKGIILQDGGEIGICISLDETKMPFGHTLHLIPKIVSIGIGCRKDTPLESIEAAALTVLQQEKININAICGVGSIDLKQNEKGLIEFAEKHHLPLHFYSAKELMQAEGSFTGSDFVEQVTQTDNVCERAAVLLSDGGRLIKRKTVIDGVTVALAMTDWSVIFEN